MIIHKFRFKVENFLSFCARRPIKHSFINSSIGGLGERKSFLLISQLLKCKVCNPIKIKMRIFY